MHTKVLVIIICWQYLAIEYGEAADYVLSPVDGYEGDHEGEGERLLPNHDERDEENVL